MEVKNIERIQMVDEQIMLDTVKRLFEAGIDEPTIVSTLTEAGLTNEQAMGVISRAKGTPTQSSQPADMQTIRNEVSTQAQVQEMQQTQMHNRFDIHEQKIDEMSQKVDEVKQVVSSPSPVDPALSYRLSELEQKVAEVNAATSASLGLLKQILETNRKILTELEAKK